MLFFPAVNGEKLLTQLIHFKGKVLEAESNTANMRKFLTLAQQAF